MLDKTLFKTTIGAFGLAAFASIGAAQNPPINGVVHLTTNIGSFKLFNGDGTVTLHFKGTVLIRGYTGTPSTSGRVKKEYDAHGRQAFFGDGTFIFTGHFESIQWFGSNLDCTWDGRGGFRVYGDYDKDLHTGWMWYGSDVAHRTAWPTQSGNYYLPVKVFQGAQPVLKSKGSG